MHRDQGCHHPYTAVKPDGGQQGRRGRATGELGAPWFLWDEFVETRAKKTWRPYRDGRKNFLPPLQAGLECKRSRGLPG
jgi:hypothetical protein